MWNWAQKNVKRKVFMRKLNFGMNHFFVAKWQRNGIDIWAELFIFGMKFLFEVSHFILSWLKFLWEVLLQWNWSLGWNFYRSFIELWMSISMKLLFSRIVSILKMRLNFVLVMKLKFDMIQKLFNFFVRVDFEIGMKLVCLGWSLKSKEYEHVKKCSL